MSESPALTPGTLLADRYRLERRIGVGGMAEVWEAEDVVLARRVAVKLATRAPGDEAIALARFEREARTGARLHHPGVATVFDYGADAAGAFLVMELLAGETLAARMAHGPIPAEEAAAVAADVADALAAAHDQGVVHRDVKPSNVMLTERHTKVMDFGIATGAEDLTSTGLVVGTAAYLAPERVRGERAGPAADVYALGVVLVEAITGERLFAGATPAESALAVLHGEVPDLHGRADVPPHVAQAAAAALDRDPDRRPSAADLARRLRGQGPALAPTVADAGPPLAAGTAVLPAADEEPTPPAPSAVGREPPAEDPTADRSPTAALAAVAVLALLALVAWALWPDGGSDPGDDRDPTAATAPGPTSAPTPPTTPPPPPTTAAPAPTTVPTTTTSTTATTTPTTPPPAGSGTELASAALTYIETLAAGDTQSAWTLTSPAFRSAQDRQSWVGYWTSFDSIEVAGDPQVDPGSGQVVVPIRWDRRLEPYTLTLVRAENGRWLVDGPVGR